VPVQMVYTLLPRLLGQHLSMHSLTAKLFQYTDLYIADRDGHDNTEWA